MHIVLRENEWMRSPPTNLGNEILSRYQLTLFPCGSNDKESQTHTAWRAVIETLNDCSACYQLPYTPLQSLHERFTSSSLKLDDALYTGDSTRQLCLSSTERRHAGDKDQDRSCIRAISLLYTAICLPHNLKPSRPSLEVHHISLSIC